jgi:hypothetical protein
MMIMIKILIKILIVIVMRRPCPPNPHPPRKPGLESEKWTKVVARQQKQQPEKNVPPNPTRARGGPESALPCRKKSESRHFDTGPLNQTLSI